MLWVEAEVIFADIPCQKPKYQRTCDILRIHGKSAKFHIRRWYPNPGKNTDITFFKGRSILNRCLQYRYF